MRKKVMALVEKYDNTYKDCRDKKGVISDWIKFFDDPSDIEGWLQVGVIEAEYAAWMEQEEISSAQYFEFSNELLEYGDLDIYAYAPVNVSRAIHMWDDGKLGGDIIEEVIKGTFEISRWKGN